MFNCFAATSADRRTVGPMLSRVDVVFNMAGEISHSHSMQFPERDLEINALSQMIFLRECSQRIPGVRVVYAGTRQVYGRPQYLPVDEEHPVAPVDYNGVSKHAAAEYHLMLTRAGLLDAVIMRLTNTYGPRLAVNVPCQGVLPVFFMRLLLGLPLEVLGDGEQLRDPLYVDDVVDALLLAGAAGKLESRVYNVGGEKALPLGQIAALLSWLAGAPPPVYRPFPGGQAHRYRQFLRRLHAGSPRIAVAAAHLARRRRSPDAQFFREHLRDYLDPANGCPQCHLRGVTEKAPEYA